MNKNNEQIVDLLHQLLYKIDKIDNCVSEIKQMLESDASNAYECELAYEKEKIARRKLRQIKYERWFEENYGEKRREAKDERNA